MRTYPYAINIYIYESLAAPYAKAVGSIALYIGRPQSNTTSLPHEMGHCLNLFHTHHIFNCYELVNGSNCVTCGDYVCDTPADPGLYTNMYWVNSNCSYIGTFRDQNGSTYNPDTRNFMSYSIHTCRNRFTVEQGNRMYNSLNTLAVLAPVKSAPVIQGNNLFCTNATFTQTSPPDNTLISWYVTPSYLVSPSSGSGATANLTKVINGNGFITFINECYTLAPFAFHTGPYSSNDYPVTGPDYASCNQSVYYSVPNLPGTTSINWTWPSEWNYVSGQGTTQLALNTGSYSQYYNAVAAGVNNICGSSGSYAYRFTSVSPCYYLMASPNPAGEELTVTFAEATDSNPSGYLDHENEITLRNHNQELMFTVRSTKKKVIIPTKSLPSGLYILTVANNKGAEQKQILIEHN